MFKDEKTGILYRKWGDSPSKISVILIHGMGAHSERWAFMGNFFAGNGMTSYALALKGFGETDGVKGHIDSFETYYKDILTLRNIIINDNPGSKVVLLGESMGGLISFVCVCQNPELFDALICLVPAFKSRMKLSFFEYLKLFVFLLVKPHGQIKMSFSGKMCTRDIKYEKAMEKDPREHRYASAKLLWEILKIQIATDKKKYDINKPVLFMSAGADKLVDSALTEKVFNDLSSENKKLIMYPDMYHALSIELGKEKVFEDILNWIKTSYSLS
ncbi:MAG: alpha/beta hydrolase [Candidatus Omnitrophica bacterium]|nr:alpha/beta hydrolase [Candidatus Omnitrophota bacterium]